jgi:hypothetical protein
MESNKFNNQMIVVHKAMATTKRAHYRFVVKEGSTEAREVREGVIDLIADPFIVAESRGREPASEHPFEGPDFLSFDLKVGTSLADAEGIAEFLTEHLQAIALTTFEDAQEVIREVKQSGHTQRIEAERFSMVSAFLREKLAAGDPSGIAEALKAVDSVAADLVNGWSKAVATSEAIMKTFGQGEDPDA